MCILNHHAVKCQGAASYHAFSQRVQVHAGCQFSPGSMFHVALISWIARSPKMHCIHLLVNLMCMCVRVHGHRHVDKGKGWTDTGMCLNCFIVGGVISNI